MKNTDDSKSSKGDQFFTKAEQCLFLSIFYYIVHVYKDQPEKQNLNEVMRMLLMAKVSEQKEDMESDLDKLFNKLRRLLFTVTSFLLCTDKIIRQFSVFFIVGDPCNVIIRIDKNNFRVMFFCFFRCHLCIAHENDMIAHSDLTGSGTV